MCRHFSRKHSSAYHSLEPSLKNEPECSLTTTKLQNKRFYLLIMTAPLYMTENVGILKRFLRIQRRVSYAHSSRDQRLAEVRYNASHMIHCNSPLIQMILNITNFQPQIKSYATEMRGSVFYIDILEIKIFWSMF